jgi:hypothetical protein
MFFENKHRMNNHHSSASYNEADAANSVEFMYHLADLYDVKTLWNKTGWNLESQISIVTQQSVLSTKY